MKRKLLKYKRSLAIADLIWYSAVVFLLKTNEFVVIISTDYSKAFDTLKHSTLAEKLNTFDIPDNIYNWFLNYFSGRGHVTRFAGETSGIAWITASVIQGSVVGPPSFITCSSGLHPVHKL